MKKIAKFAGALVVIGATVFWCSVFAQRVEMRRENGVSFRHQFNDWVAKNVDRLDLNPNEDDESLF